TYDMYAMTAAHPTLPLPSYARVTNLSNNKSVIVRVNDRGPFLNDRVIDLSYTAAYKLGIISDGSAEVEVVSLNPDVSINTIAANSVQSQPLESAPVAPVAAPDAASFAAAPAVIAAPAAAAVAAPASPPLASKGNAVYLQLGAFSSQAGAEAYRDKMSKLLGGTGKQLMVTTNKDGLLRVNIGPYANLGEARSSAEGMEADLGFKPMVNLQ
ncbi:MAG TPA: septal ring lytic transglycosylase RlpA family protein, partial [Gallionella sp.]|nr:septal ring lytic transglycosylase RlpA family protein [Gallionella sp.]